jgi:hypothetical protein
VQGGADRPAAHPAPIVPALDVSGLYNQSVTTPSGSTTRQVATGTRTQPYNYGSNGWVIDIVRTAGGYSITGVAPTDAQRLSYPVGATLPGGGVLADRYSGPWFRDPTTGEIRIGQSPTFIRLPDRWSPLTPAASRPATPPALRTGAAVVGAVQLLAIVGEHILQYLEVQEHAAAAARWRDTLNRLAGDTQPDEELMWIVRWGFADAIRPADYVDPPGSWKEGLRLTPVYVKKGDKAGQLAVLEQTAAGLLAFLNYLKTSESNIRLIDGYYRMEISARYFYDEWLKALKGSVQQQLDQTNKRRWALQVEIGQMNDLPLVDRALWPAILPPAQWTVLQRDHPGIAAGYSQDPQSGNYVRRSDFEDAVNAYHARERQDAGLPALPALPKQGSNQPRGGAGPQGSGSTSGGSRTMRVQFSSDPRDNALMDLYEVSPKLFPGLQVPSGQRVFVLVPEGQDPGAARGGFVYAGASQPDGAVSVYPVRGGQLTGAVEITVQSCVEVASPNCVVLLPPRAGYLKDKSDTELAQIMQAATRKGPYGTEITDYDTYWGARNLLEQRGWVIPVAGEPVPPKQARNDKHSSAAPSSDSETASAGELPGRVELSIHVPPAEFVEPGGLFTGRVQIKEKTGVSVRPETIAAFLGGLLVQIENNVTRVQQNGLFVITAPETPGEQKVFVRSESVAPLAEARLVVPATEEASRRNPVLRAPAALVSTETWVVRGEFPDAGAPDILCLAGGEPAPLLWKTSQAAGFDMSRAAPGPQPVALYGGGRLIASDILNIVTLTASTDKTELRPGERATFEVTVRGVPESATLEYINRTHQIGGFLNRPDRFHVPITAGRNEGGAFRDRRQYKALTPGRFNVRVNVHLPEQLTTPRPLGLRADY